MGFNYKKIKAWQHADNLVFLLYSKTGNFPKHELYGITSQIRRAAVSVPTNIAEGSNRRRKNEYIHFLFIARGSLAEVEYLLSLSRKLQLLKETDFIELDSLRQETAKTLNGLINFAKKEI